MAKAAEGFEVALSSALQSPYIIVLNQFTESFTNGYFDACTNGVYQAFLIRRGPGAEAIWEHTIKPHNKLPTHLICLSVAV